MLLDSLPGVKIIDTREIIAKQDCADFLCHMKLSGQKKIADKVVAEMNLKKPEKQAFNFFSSHRMSRLVVNF